MGTCQDSRVKGSINNGVHGISTTSTSSSPPDSYKGSSVVFLSTSSTSNLSSLCSSPLLIFEKTSTN
ncbi:hypothetical protein BpHYR1_008987 [Brachionus plicatilis]|uniref:Uncharacterized protein n=1 Tax=Brachionus plicatilis TaxID=10195 RepID=A0A3M7RLM4_BRAPC|nr:hypothetical protein BpHYR1_008987 [Brachionus plicatilis]